MARQKKDKDGLTYRQRKFVEAYRGDGVAAAIEAGYKADNRESLKQISYKNMHHPKVIAAIEKRDKEEKARTRDVLTKEEVLSKLSDIAENPSATPTARIQALERLGKAHGIFADGIEDESSLLYLESLSDLGLQKIMLETIGDYVLGGNITLGKLTEYLQGELDAEERVKKAQREPQAVEEPLEEPVLDFETAPWKS